MREVVIVSAVRTPVGKAYKGTLRATRPDDLAATAIKGALERVPQLDPKEIEDVILGCAMPEADVYKRQLACCSAYSVEPISPSSSASQLAKTSVRLGRQPVFSSSPTPRTASSCAAVPLPGSTAPYTQASR